MTDIEQRPKEPEIDVNQEITICADVDEWLERAPSLPNDIGGTALTVVLTEEQCAALNDGLWALTVASGYHD